MRSPNPRPFVAVMLVALACSAPSTRGDGAAFQVTVTKDLAPQPVSGRLILGLITPGSTLGADASPLDAPFWSERQPIFAIDVKNLTPEKPLTVDDAADFAFAKPSQLKPGTYKAAARLITTHQTSNWRHDPGNLFTQTITFTIPETGASPTVAIPLTDKTAARVWPAGAAPTQPQLYEIRSKLLSDFHHADVSCRAGIVYPTGFDGTAGRKYAAIYFVPGFGGDHFDAMHLAADRASRAASTEQSPEAALDRETFVIVLDPESPNGHTLFADSDNNGPRGKALVDELIPALEAKLPLIAKPEARLLRGHSSGGWSTLWLALVYPNTFGATWSTSPDPIDFRSFELVDIYADENMYKKDGLVTGVKTGLARPLDPAGSTARADALKHSLEWPSFRDDHGPAMTVREENAGERLLGPNRTSGQQWASWQAVWGPRNPDGSIAALYDDRTGEFHKDVVAHYQRYDIGYLLRSNPGVLAPLFRDRVRIIVGGADSFYLEEAVLRVKNELEELDRKSRAGSGPAKNSPGYITIVPGTNHGTVFDTDAMRHIPVEMLEHLRRSGIIKPEVPAK